MSYMIVVWFFLIYYYICLIIWPNCFNNIKEKVIEKEKISDNSILRIVYINKNVYPKFKIVVYEFIVILLLNLFFSSLFILYKVSLISTEIYNTIGKIYIVILLFLGTIPIIYLNIKNKILKN